MEDHKASRFGSIKYRTSVSFAIDPSHRDISLRAASVSSNRRLAANGERVRIRDCTARNGGSSYQRVNTCQSISAIIRRDTRENTWPVVSLARVDLISYRSARQIPPAAKWRGFYNCTR